MTAVSFFRYLVRTLSSTDNDRPAVERNLWRAWVKWVRLEKILVRKVADNRKEGRFYVEVVQAVFLFGSKTWILTPRLEKALVGFHH